MGKDFLRVQIDLAFPLEDGKLNKDAQEAHDLLIDAIAKAKALSREITEVPTESTTRATRHVCRHADGLPCLEVEDVDDRAVCVADARARAMKE